MPCRESARPDLVLTVNGDAVSGTGTISLAGGALNLPDTGLRLSNGYGPVECMVFVTVHRLIPGEVAAGDRVAIGRPLAGKRVQQGGGAEGRVGGSAARLRLGQGVFGGGDIDQVEYLAGVQAQRAAGDQDQGDWLYQHWTPFHDVANDVGHATVKVADDVGHVADSAWHKVSSFENTLASVGSLF